MSQFQSMGKKILYQIEWGLVQKKVLKLVFKYEEHVRWQNMYALPPVEADITPVEFTTVINSLSVNVRICTNLLGRLRKLKNEAEEGYNEFLKENLQVL